MPSLVEFSGSSWGLKDSNRQVHWGLWRSGVDSRRLNLKTKSVSNTLLGKGDRAGRKTAHYCAAVIVHTEGFPARNHSGSQKSQGS